MMPCDADDIVSFATTFGMVMPAILILPFYAGSAGQKVWVTHRKDLINRAEHRKLFTARPNPKKLFCNTPFSHSLLFHPSLNNQQRDITSQTAGNCESRTETSDYHNQEECTWRA